jgi:hypothetical protein
LSCGHGYQRMNALQQFRFISPPEGRAGAERPSKQGKRQIHDGREGRGETGAHGPAARSDRGAVAQLE